MGSGPFPTELFDETGERLCDIGHEFGAVTGRRRRCGWLDMVALKYSIMVNGVTQLIMMKSDVMNDFDTIRVATAYEIGGRTTSEFPYEITGDLRPVYTEFEGWKCDLRRYGSYEEFPEAFKRYVEFIERQTGVPVKIISVGPTAAKRSSDKQPRIPAAQWQVRDAFLCDFRPSAFRSKSRLTTRSHCDNCGDRRGAVAYGLPNRQSRNGACFTP